MRPTPGRLIGGRAIATYYVDGAAGSNANPGSSGSPFATIDYGLSAIGTSGGHTLVVRDTGVYSISSTLTIAGFGSPNDPTRIVGCTTTPGDGGRPTIRATAAVAGFTLTGTNWLVAIESFIIDGGSTGTQGVVATAGTSFCFNLIRCRVTGWTQEGISTNQQSGTIWDCEVDGCGGTNGAIAITGGSPAIQGGSVHGNSSTGIYASSTVFAHDVAVYGNAGYGLNATNWPHSVRGCTFHGNGNSGAKLNYTLEYQISNNIFTSNGGYGLEVSSATSGLVNPRLDYNWFGTGSLANTSAARSSNLLAGPHDLSGDPQYVNAGTGDFTPQNALVQAGSP